MVIVPASAVVADGLTFTVVQITWTTRGGGLTTTTSGTAEASTLITPTPRSRPPLPRYRAKRVDNSDLLEALDRADHKLLEASNLVDSFLRKPDQAATTNFFDSRRSTCVTTHEQLETSLMITSTPTGRTVKLKTASPDQNFPYGLSNAANQFLRHTQSLFGKSGLSLTQNSQAARHFINMVSIRVLLDGKATSTNSSTGSVPTEVLHHGDEDYDLDLPPYPLGFSRFPVFPPQRGDLIFNVSNDEVVVDGKTDEQRQLREQHNADRAQRRADEERQLAPHNLSDAFDMVGNQQVYKTPSANVVVAMANLDRLPDTPEYQGIRSNIRAHLIAAMGQTATLLKRVQAVSYTEVSFDQTHCSQTSPRPSGRHHSRSPTNDRRKDTRRDNHGRDTGSYREQRHRRGQEVNQDKDLRHNIPHKDVRESTNRRITERAVHENV